MPRGPDPEISPIEILEVFIVNPDPAFVIREIADILDVSSEGARHRMNKLVEKGLLKKKKSGPQTVLYWITNDGIEYYRDKSEDR